MACESARDTRIKRFKGKRVHDRRVWKPCRVGKCTRVVEADLIFEVADVIGRVSEGTIKRAIVKDAVDRSSVSVDVCELAETIFWDIILRDGKSVVIQAELGYC